MSWLPPTQSTDWRLVLCGAACTSALLFIGCDAARTDFLGDGFVAPAQLNLRRELSGKTGNVAVLKHGDHVGILDMRRRFVKVRSDRGFQGWVDSAQLLSAEQMDALNAEIRHNLRLPSQGEASVFEPLNVHIEPNRQSPALARIVEGERVSVLHHQLVSKNAPPPKLGQLIKPRTVPTRRKKEKQTRALRLPLPPRPPKVPDNWQQLSAERIDGGASTADLKARMDAEAAAKKAEAASKPVMLEDWTLIRISKNGRGVETGWVLTRNLVMSIPDEVAQYAEGKRITSYLNLGSVKDEELGVRHNWLWTTASSQHAFDFDGWRVFLWNRRRHRYETSFRQRDVEGYYPVSVDTKEPGAFGSTFHLITKDEDGKVRRRTYFFDGTRVHLTGTEDYNGAEVNDEKSGAVTEGNGKKPGWLSRHWQQLSKKFARPQ